MRFRIDWEKLSDILQFFLVENGQMAKIPNPKFFGATGCFLFDFEKYFEKNFLYLHYMHKNETTTDFKLMNLGFGN